MLNLMKRRTVDLLIEQFWKQGYLTVSRKFGTYLPEPSKVGGFEVDIIAKYKKDYAIGITITGEELNDPKILEKLHYLATRKTKYTGNRVILYVGAETDYIKNLRVLVSSLSDEVKKNIKVIPIAERQLPVRRRGHAKSNILFS